MTLKTEFENSLDVFLDHISSVSQQDGIAFYNLRYAIRLN